MVTVPHPNMSCKKGFPITVNHHLQMHMAPPGISKCGESPRPPTRSPGSQVIEGIVVGRADYPSLNQVLIKAMIAEAETQPVGQWRLATAL